MPPAHADSRPGTRVRPRTISRPMTSRPRSVGSGFQRSRSTHPFSSWITQEITPFERYLGVRKDMADLAQQLLIFGTHVHIGIEDRDFLIDAMNVSRYFLPHVLCLSASSPFWQGRKTGLKSYRSVVFVKMRVNGGPLSMYS